LDIGYSSGLHGSDAPFGVREAELAQCLGCREVVSHGAADPVDESESGLRGSPTILCIELLSTDVTVDGALDDLKSCVLAPHERTGDRTRSH
jgi:hypothetical protein